MRSTRRRVLVLTPAVSAALVALALSLLSCSQESSTAPTPARTPANGDEARRAVLGKPARWQWVLGAPFDVDDPSHLGTNWQMVDGQAVPPPAVYDLDGFTTDAATVAALQAGGATVVCYIETGAWESYRPDAHQYPSEVLGHGLNGYPDERYVDIRSSAVFDRVRERVETCADKGFDAVEPDIDDSYAEDTGFEITIQDNLEFNAKVAELAHEEGLLIALKNGDDPEFAAAMEPRVDFAIVEQCFEFDTCRSFDPFIQAGKPVLVAEYNLDPAQFCPLAIQRGFAAVRFDVELTGRARPCS